MHIFQNYKDVIYWSIFDFGHKTVRHLQQRIGGIDVNSQK
jgi:hypothetical protein